MQLSGVVAGEPVELLDAMGRVVRTVMPTAADATLDVRSLAAGMYLVRCGAQARRLVVE